MTTKHSPYKQLKAQAGKIAEAPSPRLSSVPDTAEEPCSLCDSAGRCIWACDYDRLAETASAIGIEDYPAPQRFTHAIWARELGRLTRLTAQALTRETDGMESPLFCSSDARPWAVSVIADARAILDWAELRIRRHVDDGEAAKREPSPTANSDAASDMN